MDKKVKLLLVALAAALCVSLLFNIILFQKSINKTDNIILLSPTVYDSIELTNLEIAEVITTSDSNVNQHTIKNGQFTVYQNSAGFWNMSLGDTVDIELKFSGDANSIILGYLTDEHTLQPIFKGGIDNSAHFNVQITDQLDYQFVVLSYSLSDIEVESVNISKNGTEPISP